MLRDIYNALVLGAKSVTNYFRRVIATVTEFFAMLFKHCFFALKWVYFKTIFPAAKFFYTILKYIALGIYFIYYYLVQVPVYHTSIWTYSKIILPVNVFLCFAGNKISVFCKAVYNGLILCFNWLYEKIIKAFFLCIFRTIQFISVKFYFYLILPICKFFRYIFIKLKIFFLQIGHFLKYLFQSFCRLLAEIGRLVYKFFIYPIYVSFSFLLRCIKIAVISIEKFLYKYLLYPIYFSAKWLYELICRALIFLYEKISSALKFVWKYIKYISLKLAHWFMQAVRFIFRYIKLVLTNIGKFLYKYLLYPIYFSAKWLYELICRALIFLYKKISSAIKFVWKYIKIALINIGKFFYKYLLYPICFSAKWLYELICRALIFLYEKISSALKFLWKYIKCMSIKLAQWFVQAVKFSYKLLIIIIFLPLIIGFYLIMMFIVSPCFILSINIPNLALREIFLNPYYILAEFKKRESAKLELLKQQKSDLFWLRYIKYYCGLVTVLLWSILLYPVSFFVLLLKRE